MDDLASFKADLLLRMQRRDLVMCQEIIGLIKFELSISKEKQIKDYLKEQLEVWELRKEASIDNIGYLNDFYLNEVVNAERASKSAGFTGGAVKVEARELNAVDGVVKEGIEVGSSVGDARKRVVKPLGNVWRNLVQGQVNEGSDAVGCGVGNGEHFGQGGGSVQVGHVGAQKIGSLTA